MITGSITMWPGDTLPAEGYLPCNGAAVSRTTYADLYAVLADRYGSGDGSTTFNLPDLRGQFPRFVDAGRGIDPDSRIARVDGANTNTDPGTTQAEQIDAHTHSALNLNLFSVFGAFGPTKFQYAGGSSNWNTSSKGSEQRPNNISIWGLIKI